MYIYIYKYIYIYIYVTFYVYDIFFFVDDSFLRNYADDTALYSVQKSDILNQSILMYLQK